MDPEQARILLARERARIEQALAALGLGQPDDDPDPFEASDVAPDLQENEVDMGLADSLRRELEAIGRADERLAAGTYGVSVDSGAPIPDARLEALPWAERTTEEQARFERA
jgi:DnaK suppressor protein